MNCINYQTIQPHDDICESIQNYFRLQNGESALGSTISTTVIDHNNTNNTTTNNNKSISSIVETVESYPPLYLTASFDTTTTNSCSSGSSTGSSNISCSSRNSTSCPSSSATTRENSDEDDGGNGIETLFLKDDGDEYENCDGDGYDGKIHVVAAHTTTATPSPLQAAAITMKKLGPMTVEEIESDGDIVDNPIYIKKSTNDSTSNQPVVNKASSALGIEIILDDGRLLLKKKKSMLSTPKSNSSSGDDGNDNTAEIRQTQLTRMQVLTKMEIMKKKSKQKYLLDDNEVAPTTIITALTSYSKEGTEKNVANHNVTDNDNDAGLSSPSPTSQAEELEDCVLNPGSEDEDDPKPSCSICMERFKVGDNISLSPVEGCHHVFHHDCIREWLLRRTGCPCCRVIMLPIDRPKPKQLPEHRYITTVQQSADEENQNSNNNNNADANSVSSQVFQPRQSWSIHTTTPLQAKNRSRIILAEQQKSKITLERLNRKCGTYFCVECGLIILKKELREDLCTKELLQKK